MNGIILPTIVLVVSLYALSRVIDLYFIETLEIISRKFRHSSDIAGATFMAAGSSAPELFVAVLALSWSGSQQAIGAGTIVGSAIFNILVIIGASALFRKAVLIRQPVIRDLLFYITAILILLFVFIDGKITIFDAALFVSFYVTYLFSFSAWKDLFPYRIQVPTRRAREEEAKRELAEVKHEHLSLVTIPDKIFSFFFFDLQKNRPCIWSIFVFLSQHSVSSATLW